MNRKTKPTAQGIAELSSPSCWRVFNACVAHQSNTGTRPESWGAADIQQIAAMAAVEIDDAARFVARFAGTAAPENPPGCDRPAQPGR